ncbi:hypothetical protein [Enterobacter hormaechei]|uniref:hypothetical protein n=2 Tax=Enterobacter hormaechei TaxID=158836 RepID=UPI00111307D2|nr:hypothetical protein [Enterobacter hormaechei]
MMARFSRIKLNPLDVVRGQFGVELNHIAYDSSLRKADCHYQVIRQTSHDGTLLFTHELLASALAEIAKMHSYSKNLPPKHWDKVIAIKYTLGPLWLTTVYGRVNLPAGSYPGEKQRVRMSVVCEYIYADGDSDA